MRKEYIKPAATIVNIATEFQLLAGSGDKTIEISYPGETTQDPTNIEEEFEFN